MVLKGTELLGIKVINYIINNMIFIFILWFLDQYECVSCEGSSQVWKIVGLFMMQLGALYICIQGGMNLIQTIIYHKSFSLLFRIPRPSIDQQGVIFKILHHYLFVLGGITSIKLSFPDYIINITSMTGNQSQSLAFSFDCFIKDFGGDMPLVFFRIFWQVGVSLLQAGIVVGVSWVLLRIKKQEFQVRGCVFITVIYKYISMYPEVVTMLLEVSLCKEVGGEQYLIGNSTVKCDQYEWYSWFVVFPLIIIWGVGIPLGMLLYLLKIRRNSKENGQNSFELYKNLQNIGFLYIEYKEKLFYWELVKIVQKFTIAILFALYFNYIYIKGVLVFLILFGYFVL